VREFLGADRLRGVRLVDVTVSTEGGFAITEVPGTERDLPADLALLAIGFAGTEPGPMLEQAGLTRNRRGTLDCGADWQTGTPGVFVAGDMRRGPSLIVWAIAEGRAAAAAVHNYLGGAGQLPSPVTPESASLALR
jgi:glutamate synthase (NADPH/NADH) small chain